MTRRPWTGRVSVRPHTGPVGEFAGRPGPRFSSPFHGSHETRRLEKGSEAPAVLHVEGEVGPEEGLPPALASWAIPTFAVLFLMNLLDYMDRNILYAVLPQVKTALRLHTGMATFSSAGVSNKD